MKKMVGIIAGFDAKLLLSAARDSEWGSESQLLMEVVVHVTQEMRTCITQLAMLFMVKL
jgi:hypothetical protein